MHVKTLAISEDTHRQLLQLKVQLGYPSVDTLERDLIAEFRKRRLHEASATFRKELKRKGVTFKQFLAEAAVVRRELADEYERRTSRR